jgi:hypothetical protein
VTVAKRRRRRAGKTGIPWVLMLLEDDVVIWIMSSVH